MTTPAHPASSPPRFGGPVVPKTPPPQLNMQLQPPLREPIQRVATTAQAAAAATAPAPPTGTSTGTKVAVGAAAVAGGTIVTVAIVSAIAGWTIQKTLDHAWDKVTGHKSKRR
jgi:hypothetical protein